MTFKTIDHKHQPQAGKELFEEERNDDHIFENDNHGSFSIHKVKESVAEEGLSHSEKRDRRIDKRLLVLEKIGVKRGIQRKLFSIIGITLMFLLSLCCMYLCYILLSDIIDLVERTDNSIIQISDIEIKK